MQRSEGGLDSQFEKLAGQLSVLALSQPRPVKLRVHAWLTKLREPTSNAVWKRNRNLYCALLLAQLQQGRLEPPFTATPPDGALPNLPNHLAYRGLSPSRAAGTSRSRSSSPGGVPPRSKSPASCVQRPLAAGCSQPGLTRSSASGCSQSRPHAAASCRAAASGDVTLKPQPPCRRSGECSGGSGPSRACSRGRCPGRDGGVGAPGDTLKSDVCGGSGVQLQRDQHSGRCTAWEAGPVAGDGSYTDQDELAAALLEAKEAEIAARVAAKRRQELEERLRLEEEAKQQQRQRNAAAKAQLDAVITRYSDARQQWASPRGAESPHASPMEQRGDTGTPNWTPASAAASGATARMPASPGTLRLLHSPQDWTECGGPGAEKISPSTGRRGSSAPACRNHLRNESTGTLRLTSPRATPSPQERSPSPRVQVVSASAGGMSGMRRSSPSPESTNRPPSRLGMLASPQRPMSPHGRPASCSPQRRPSPAVRSRSCSPASSPNRLPTADPAVIHNLVRHLRSPPREPHADGVTALQVTGGDNAVRGSASGFLMPCLPTEEPARRSTAPAKFEFSNLIASLLPSSTMAELQDQGCRSSGDAAMEEDVRHGGVGLGTSIGRAHSGRRASPEPQASSRGVKSACVGHGGAVCGGESPGRSPGHTTSLSPPTSPFASSHRVAALAATSSRARAGNPLPPSSCLPPGGQKQPPLARSPSAGSGAGRQPASLPLGRSGGRPVLSGTGSATASGLDRSKPRPRPPSPFRVHTSAPVPSSIRLTELARQSMAACLPSVPSCILRSPAMQQGSGSGAQAGRHSWTGQGEWVDAAGGMRSTGAAAGGGSPDDTVDLSPVAAGQARQQSVQETPRLVRQPAAMDARRRAMSADYRRSTGPSPLGQRPPVSRPVSFADPAGASSNTYGQGGGMHATAPSDGLLAGLSAAAAAGELEALDVEGVITEFERWLQDHLGRLRAAQASMHETADTQRAVAGEPSTSSSATSLADRFALYSALGDFRRAVDRLKRRLALHSMDPAVAEVFFGADKGRVSHYSRRMASASQSFRDRPTSGVSHSQAWRPGGVMRTASAGRDTREGAAAGGAGDDSRNVYLKYGAAERFYRAASDAVATYREDVALLLSRVRAVLQPARLGASARSSKDSSRASGALAPGSAAAASRDVELRRGLVEDTLRLLEESANQLGLRVVALASAPVGLPPQALDELNAALCAQLNASGGRLSERLAAVGKKAARLHEKIGLVLDETVAETARSAKKGAGRTRSASSLVTSARETSPGPGPRQSLQATPPPPQSRDGAVADGWRRDGAFGWLGDMPTPSGRLDFGGQEDAVQRSGSYAADSALTPGAGNSRNPGAGAGLNGLLAALFSSPPVPLAPAAAERNSPGLSPLQHQEQPGSAASPHQLSADASPQPASCQHARSSGLSAAGSRLAEEMSSLLPGMQSSQVKAPESPMHYGLPSSSRTEHLEPAPSCFTEATLMPREDTTATAALHRADCASAFGGLSTIDLTHPRHGSHPKAPSQLASPVASPSCGSSHPTAFNLAAPEPHFEEALPRRPFQDGPGIGATQGAAGNTSRGRHPLASHQPHMHSHSASPSQQQQPPAYPSSSPTGCRPSAPAHERHGVGSGVPFTTAGVNHPASGASVQVPGSWPPDRSAVTGAQGHPGEDGRYMGEAALRLVHEAQIARRAAVAAREAVEAAMLAAAAASDAGSTNVARHEAAESYSRGPDVAPYQRRTVCSSVGSATTPQVPAASAQQQPSTTETGATYRAVVWELTAAGTGAEAAPAPAVASFPQREPSLSPGYITPAAAGTREASHSSAAGDRQAWTNGDGHTAAAAAIAVAASYEASRPLACEAVQHMPAAIPPSQPASATPAALSGGPQPQHCQQPLCRGNSSPRGCQVRSSPRGTVLQQFDTLPPHVQLGAGPVRSPSPKRRDASVRITPQAVGNQTRQRNSPGRGHLETVTIELMQAPDLPAQLVPATELSMFRKLRQQLASSPPIGADAVVSESYKPRTNQRERNVPNYTPTYSERHEPDPVALPSTAAASAADAAAPVTTAVSLGLNNIRDYQAFQLVKRKLGLIEASPPNHGQAATAASPAKGANKSPRAPLVLPPAPPPPHTSLCSSAIAPGGASCGGGLAADRAAWAMVSTAGSGCKAPLAADAVDPSELSLRLQRLADRTSKLQQRMAMMGRQSPPRS